MRWASEFSQRMSAALSFLHVVPPMSDTLTLPSEEELQEELRKGALAKLEAIRRAARIAGRLMLQSVKSRRH